MALLPFIRTPEASVHSGLRAHPKCSPVPGRPLPQAAKPLKGQPSPSGDSHSFNNSRLCHPTGGFCRGLSSQNQKLRQSKQLGCYPTLMMCWVPETIQVNSLLYACFPYLKVNNVIMCTVGGKSKIMNTNNRAMQSMGFTF